MNFREIAETVINASRAEQTEVLAIEQDESLTRFANNCIHQNVTERNIQITVRSVIGTKVGIAVSNDIRSDSLFQLAARAYEVAKLQPDNPEFKGLSEPQAVTPVSAFDSACGAVFRRWRLVSHPTRSRLATRTREAREAPCASRADMMASGRLSWLRGSSAACIPSLRALRSAARRSAAGGRTSYRRGAQPIAARMRPQERNASRSR